MILRKSGSLNYIFCVLLLESFCFVLFLEKRNYKVKICQLLKCIQVNLDKRNTPNISFLSILSIGINFKNIYSTIVLYTISKTDLSIFMFIWVYCICNLKYFFLHEESRFTLFYRDGFVS